jgi:beta-lactamase regulating signal transducer with metallopeptidase domain
MKVLAWTLLHFLWQGAAIAALAGALMTLFRASSTRYLIGIGALALMFASFGVTFALLSTPPAGGDGLTAASMPISADVAPAPAANFIASATPAHEIPPEPDFAWVARAWLVGVCLLALRIALGLLLLEQLRRRNLSALPVEIVERCRALQQRLGISRVVRYCECRMVNVPSVIGFFRPVVLLPMRALTGLSPEQLEAVIAHELGHVKRFDVAVNFIQVIAETVFFFHPAVWWLNKRIRADREDCCDDVAIATCGRNVSYARALATMEGWRDTPEFAMAATGGAVSNRVARLLGFEQKDGARTAGVITASVVLAAALMAGAASIGFAQPTAPSADPSFAALDIQMDVPPAAMAPATVVVATPCAGGCAGRHGSRAGICARRGQSQARGGRQARCRCQACGRSSQRRERHDAQRSLVHRPDEGGRLRQSRRRPAHRAQGTRRHARIRARHALRGLRARRRPGGRDEVAGRHDGIRGAGPRDGFQA